MNKIVILEDDLGIAISLANQFVEFKKKYPKYEISEPDICYFCSDTMKANQRINSLKKQDFNIKHVSLLNFNKTFDDYINSKEEHVIIIIDYILEDDGSDGIPMERVNIRYVLRQDEDKLKQIWFYTARGTTNYENLCEIIGAEHVLEVKETGADFLKLDLENEKFFDSLLENKV